MIFAVALLAALVAASPCSEAIPLGPGDKTPCEGLLVPPGDAVRCVRCLTVDLPGCQLDSRVKEEIADIDHRALAEQLDLERSRVRRLGEGLVRATQPPPLWRHPMLWFAVGVVVSGSATLWLLDKENPR